MRNFNMFNEIDRVTDEYKRRYMPETEIDPSCRTFAYDARIEDAEKYLWENPESLLEIDIERITAIVKANKYDEFEIGRLVKLYYAELIEAQAKESVDIELNI